MKQRLICSVVLVLTMFALLSGSDLHAGTAAAPSAAVGVADDSSLRNSKKDAPEIAPLLPKLPTAPGLQPVRPVAVLNGLRDKKKMALTFDACSTRKPSHYDERVTEVLVRMNTPATIFLGGKWMEEKPEHTKYLASNPLFELGNHTFLHPHLPAAADARIKEELLRTQQVMFALTGRQATLFRPPYGEYDDRVVRIAAGLGLTTIEYDLPSGDPDPLVTKEKLVCYVTKKAKNGSIVVMHINQRGRYTAEALPEIIETLRKKGFELVTVGELLRDLSAQQDAERARKRTALKQ